MAAASRERLERWSRKLADLVGEMEEANGESSPGINPDILEEAVRVASHVAYTELNHARTLEREFGRS